MVAEDSGIQQKVVKKNGFLLLENSIKNKREFNENGIRYIKTEREALILKNQLLQIAKNDEK